MHKYEVKFSLEANEDLLDIYTYIYADLENPASAEKIVARICKKCNDLRYFPKQGAAKMGVSEEDLRFVHSGKYTIAYRVNDDAKTVDIFAIKYSRVDLKKSWGTENF